MEPIEVERLVKRYGTTTAVHDVSFRVRAGSVTALLGPNGAGKTTLLRCLLALDDPTSGSASLLGCRYRDLVDPVKQVGVALDGAPAHPGRSGRNHLRWMAAAAGITVKAVPRLLDVVGLADAADRPVRTYSLGMRQRLGLAGALLGDPDVLILDEPTNGLDPEGIAWTWEFLRSYAAGSRCVLVSTHHLAEAARAATDVVVLSRSRLVAACPIDRFTASYAGSSGSLHEAFRAATGTPEVQAS